MSGSQNDRPETVSLGEAERICREETGMSVAQFRHELAQHVRGHGGIPWVATATAVGVYRPALEAMVRAAESNPDEETSDE